MKKIFAILSFGVIIAACNKPPASYSTTAPWTGGKPMSAIIDGKSFIATTGSFANVPAANGLAAYSIVDAIKTDSSIVDSTIRTRRFIILGPTGGVPTGSIVNCNINNVTDIISYSEKITSFKNFNNGQILTDKLYSSAKSRYTSKAKLFTNSGTEYNGNFYGPLVDLQDTNNYVEISEGYFSILK